MGKRLNELEKTVTVLGEGFPVQSGKDENDIMEGYQALIGEIREAQAKGQRGLRIPSFAQYRTEWLIEEVKG